MSKRKTVEEFIEKAREIHGDKYDYSKVEYINNHTKVCIICPEHGEFWQMPNDHLKGCGCSSCCGLKKLTTEEFIKKARKIHGDKYDYSKVEYINNETMVCIICSEHGEFWQTPHTHLKGGGCPKCRYINAWNTRGRISTEEFIEKARRIHGNKYDYSKVEYKDNRTKVCIICPEHGELWQTPNDHLNNRGCPICSESYLEKEIRVFLEKEKIKYKYEKRFENFSYKSLDFYLPDYNIAIECQGIQHFEPVEFFGGKETFLKQIKNDKEKKDYCENNNIKLIYVSYRNFLKYNRKMLTIKQCIELLRLLKKTIVEE